MMVRADLPCVVRTWGHNTKQFRLVAARRLGRSGDAQDQPKFEDVVFSLEVLNRDALGSDSWVSAKNIDNDAFYYNLLLGLEL